jgi:hypothetical protein
MQLGQPAATCTLHGRNDYELFHDGAVIWLDRNDRTFYVQARDVDPRRIVLLHRFLIVPIRGEAEEKERVR